MANSPQGEDSCGMPQGGESASSGCSLDVQSNSTNEHENTSNSTIFPRLTNPGDTFSTRSTVTVNITANNSTVVITGYAVSVSNRSAGSTNEVQIDESGVGVIDGPVVENVAQNDNVSTLISTVLINVSSGSHTYNLQHRMNPSGSTTEFLIGTGISVVVFG